MKSQIDLLMGTASFFVNMEASSDKSTYKGAFKVKCVLSPLEYINSDSMYRELLGKTNPQYASEYVSQLCYAISQLKFRVVDAPDWFKNNATGIDGSGVDDNILLFILDKAVECESEYREGIEEKYKEARKEVRQSIDEGTLDNGVEKEVEEEMEDDLDD